MIGWLRRRGLCFRGRLLRCRRFRLWGASGSWSGCGCCWGARRRVRVGWCCWAARRAAGKTRLLRELAGEALERGMLVLYGASDADVTTPYEPVREWLKFLIRVCDPVGLAELPHRRRRATLTARTRSSNALPARVPRSRMTPRRTAFILQSARRWAAATSERAPASAAPRRRRALGRQRDPAPARAGSPARLRMHGCCSSPPIRDRGEEIAPPSRTRLPTSRGWTG